MSAKKREFYMKPQVQERTVLTPHHQELPSCSWWEDRIECQKARVLHEASGARENRPNTTSPWPAKRRRPDAARASLGINPADIRPDQPGRYGAMDAGSERFVGL